MKLVNFGLAKNDGPGFLTPEEVVEAFKRYSLDAEAVGTAQSDTEPTLILRLKYAIDSWAADKLCRRFKQDCFAVYDPSAKRGYLLGPRADAWGPFKAEYFLIDADGTRLSETPEAGEVKPLYIPWTLRG